ncbi:MAG: 3-oxocholest-4-en-26-oate---CoA ligase [Actinomycetota bacterium]|nr:3-oxocholest-4-en-26-oate---CoA ligase [Actinomycetota bacterium]
MSGLNIADIFETVVATVPDQPALVVRTGDGRDELRLSFAELDARVNRLAHALLELGIDEGDHVGCHLYDGNQYVETTLAAYKVRAVPVNVNFRYVDEELAYLFDNADLKVVVTEPDLEDRAARAAANLDWPCPVVVADERYEEMLSRQPDTRPDVGERSPDDRYGLWTGGTTGMPKGVMWRQEDIYLSAIGGNGNELLGVPPVVDLDDVAARARTGSPLPRILTLCPLMHGGGFWLAFNAILSGSCSMLIRDVGFDPAFAFRVIAEERVTVLMTIGDAYARPIVDLLESSRRDDFDLSSLLVYGSGGAILSPSVKDDLARLLPTTVVHDGFGASETGGQGRLIGTGADGAPRFKMDPGNVVIADDGTLCQPGDGRIGMLANSGQIPLGYYKDETKTAATFPVIDGVRYAVPGDLASVDPDGSIVVYGRGSVSINSGGEKIFPEEVEKALKSHAAVFDATVVGTPNERFGSQVTAVVELRPEHADDPPGLSDLQEHCRQHLAGYKVPRAVVFVEATRRSPSGKPDYRWAKETALAGLAATTEPV